MKRSITFLLFILSLSGFSQTMTFDTGVSEPGFTFSGYWYDASADAIYPSAPNVNWLGTIHRPSGCWDAISVNPKCWGVMCTYPSGGTWRIFSDKGDEVFFVVGTNTTTVVDLNFFAINTLYLQLVDVGTGTPNNTFNLDNIVYDLPLYPPADAPMLATSANPICPDQDIFLTPTGELNMADQWVMYTEGCGVGTPTVEWFGVFPVHPNDTTTYYVRGEDTEGCALPGDCSEITINTLQAGCLDPMACNYDSTAVCDDGSCWFPEDPLIQFLYVDQDGSPTFDCQGGQIMYIGVVVDCLFIDEVRIDDVAVPILNQNQGAGVVQLYVECPPGYGTHEVIVVQQGWESVPWEYSYTGALGCTDTTACNYDSTALCDDATCQYPGCYDSVACNFDPAALCGGGPCILPDGCTNPVACNYDSTALCDDGSCYYEQWFIPSAVNGGVAVFTCDAPAGYELADQFCAQYVIDSDPYCIETNWDGVCLTAYNCCLGNYGCSDASSCNYVPNLCDDSSLCTYPGCTDPIACNYDSTAGCDDGSCILPLWYLPNVIEGGPALFSCTPPANYYLANQYCVQTIVDGDTFCVDNSWDGICELDYQCCLGNCGCMDPFACNYDPSAIYDVGSCAYPGCTYVNACNYNPAAGCDDMSCLFTDPCGNCGGFYYPGCTDPLSDNYSFLATCDDGSCYIAGCTYPDAPEYNPAATIDDGSCTVTLASNCAADLDGNCEVNTADLLAFLQEFGTICSPCN